MCDYPNSDEEFELQYGDELELLNEQEENIRDEIVQVRPNNSARKSLDYGESLKDLFPTQKSANSSFDQSFQLIPNKSNEDAEDTQSTTEINNHGESSRKRNINELFEDMDDLLFGIKKDTKRPKTMSKREQQLVMIETILEMRKERRENNGISRNNAVEMSNNPTGNFDMVRFLGDSYKETWKEAQEILNKKLDRNTPIEEDLNVDELNENELWAEKYKPRKYLDLLSDEVTNKNLLKWLKLWDKVVFNRRPKLRTFNENEDTKFKNDFERFLTLDEDGRPRFKLALLCGRPGVGKTTLAHVVAKHAGYNVIEVNASDDRNLEYFKTTLETATRMSSVLDKRPNCVIFDEIDGAPVKSIEYLIKFASGTANKRRKKENNAMILKRPIICVCNDPYVPALRNLRQTALIFNFPTTNRLNERLMEISRKEGLKTDMGTMIALAQKSNYDVRTCLGVLQFFARQKKPITISDVYKSSVGQKDLQKGLFTVWNDIFTVERPKTRFSDVQNIPEIERMEQYNMTAKSRMKKVLSVVQNFGDYQRLAQGVFENYPDIQVKNSSLKGTCDALGWFCYTDKINKSVMEQQNFSLNSYIPYAFVNWHFQFAALVSSKINYPSEGYEARRKLNTNLSTVRELEKGLEPKIKISVNSLSLILDTLPLLTRIITPKLRPVNLHLFTKEEKDVLKNVVNAMIDYNLTYVQEKNMDGTYHFNLDPDVFSVVSFPEFSVRRNLNYTSKQLISQEIEFERIKRNQRSCDGGDVKKDVKKPQVGPSNIPNHLRKLDFKVTEEKKNEKKKNVVLKDFFVKVNKEQDQRQDKTLPPTIQVSPRKKTAIQNSILFKYNEGYSNAVRTKIRMSSIM